MLVPRIKQKTRSCFNDTTHFFSIQQLPDGGELYVDIRRPWIDGVVIDGDGDTAVSDIGQDGDRHEQRVAFEAVGVVADAKHSGFYTSCGRKRISYSSLDRRRFFRYWFP